MSHSKLDKIQDNRDKKMKIKLTYNEEGKGAIHLIMKKDRQWQDSIYESFIINNDLWKYSQVET